MFSFPAFPLSAFPILAFSLQFLLMKGGSHPKEIALPGGATHGTLRM
jgi:hypothetical protein